MKNETTASKTAEAPKKAAETKAAEVKEKITEKAAEVKETVEKVVKAVPEKAAEVEKKAAAKVTKAVKTEKAAKTEKKADKAEKKADKAVKKAADPKTNVFVEYQGAQIKAKDILKLAQKDFKKKQRGVTIKTLEIYIKPEEGVAYYVVNGEGSPDYCVFL